MKPHAVLRTTLLMALQHALSSMLCHHCNRYTRQPNNNQESQSLMEIHGVGYSSMGLVAQMRENNNHWQQGEVKITLVRMVSTSFLAPCSSPMAPCSFQA